MEPSGQECKRKQTHVLIQTDSRNGVAELVIDKSELNNVSIVHSPPSQRRDSYCAYV
jgi:hypothetical protein